MFRRDTRRAWCLLCSGARGVGNKIAQKHVRAAITPTFRRGLPVHAVSEGVGLNPVANCEEMMGDEASDVEVVHQLRRVLNVKGA